jgi:hypothetical protein
VGFCTSRPYRNLGTTYVFHIFISTTGDIPDLAVYALTGAEPIELTLDKYCITLFLGIARLGSTIEIQMLLWEFANANANDILF